MTLIEKAARALCEARLRKAGHCKSEEVLREKVGEYWPGHVGDARAVLQAIREPSEAMKDACEPILHDREINGFPQEEIWQAMIDAALAEGRG